MTQLDRPSVVMALNRMYDENRDKIAKFYERQRGIEKLRLQLSEIKTEEELGLLMKEYKLSTRKLRKIRAKLEKEKG